jgi:hypothetical protein
MEDKVSQVDRGSIHGQVECFEVLSKKQSGLHNEISISGDEWSRMEAEVAKADQVAHGREYLDEDEQLNNITPGMLAASRGVANSGADVADDFLSQGGAGMEASSSRGHYAEREALFNAMQAELGRGVLKKGSKEYDELLAQVDEQLLAQSRRPQVGDGHVRRSSRRRQLSGMGLLSAANEPRRPPPKARKKSHNVISHKKR